jgi:toxin ParE1/3/4
VSHTVIFSPEAIVHLQGVFDYIAERDSELAAERFVRKIRDHCKGFDVFPMRGTARDDIRSGMRMVGYNRQVSIAFRIDSEIVTILAIFYGGQNYDEILPIGEP